MYVLRLIVIAGLLLMSCQSEAQHGAMDGFKISEEAQPDGSVQLFVLHEGYCPVTILLEFPELTNFNLLAEDEFRLYRKLFYQVYKDIARPDLYVYLYQNTERLQANIKKRGRKYEKEIQDDYLEKINSGYLSFLRNQTELNVKIIDISDKDFVKNREDYLWLLNEIKG